MARTSKRGKVYEALHGGTKFDGLKEPFEERDPIVLALNSLALGVVARKRKADQRWGLDRLAELVSEETRLKYWRQIHRCRLAYQSRDVESYRSAVGGMMRAYDALEKEAESGGAEPLHEDVLEGQREDGSVFAVAANADSAWAYSQQRVEVDVWTLDELAVILAAPVFTQAIRLKRAMPGTEVMSVIQPEDVGPVFTGDTGTDDGYTLSEKTVEIMESMKGKAK